MAESLAWACRNLSAIGVGDPSLEARVLVEEILDLRPGALLVDAGRRMTARDLKWLARCVEMRRRHVPLQLVVGWWEFHGVPLRLSRGVFIPRPETEVLVEAVLERLPARATGTAIDLGTGTGAIAVAIKRQRPALRMVAVDSDPEAVRLARRNARLNGVALELFLQDLGRPPASHGPFDLIVSNPPYIPTGEIRRLDPEVRDHDPRRALDGGPDGLASVRKVLSFARNHLAAGGLLACEIGSDQGARVMELAREVGLDEARLAQDLTGRDRVALAVRRVTP
ncbi:MAG: peptide chain release factor N(5)-glutamine methyltransferase [Candidatus Riflebacteria bacterium]|nr:peptide chain release factor N(5)-glutamine methyltransferase [Candidatus Riflebacteria bacterium]